jgi:L-ascorbate metabolism protein UlaG (beta-lactamase superfamily)
VLSKNQLRALGRIDIAFAPVDGQMTMSHQELFEVLAAIKPMLIIPMHYGFGDAVEAFIDKARHLYPIRQHDSATIELSFRSLPRKPEVLFLQAF